MSISAFFPNVPNVPGVPNLNFGTLLTGSIPKTLIADSISSMLGLASNSWGIFDQNNNPVVIPDSVLAFDYRHEWRIANYPIEGGDFQSYNKVQVPFDARVTMAKGGTDSDRATFLKSLEAAAASLSLYSIITPDYSYLNANIVHVEFRRTATNGVGLISADIWLQEVRQSVSGQYTNTAAPSGADPSNGGTVSTTLPASAESVFNLTAGSSGSWQ